MTSPFDDFDLSDFWEDSDFARKDYMGAPLTDAAVAWAEQALGYRLPASYVALMRHQNGGIPRCTLHRTDSPTSWASDQVMLTGLFSVGEAQPCSLGGRFGSAFWISEWGYPPIGIYFADCPTAGHHMFCLDYRACGPQGEPQVVFVDQESDFHITAVAPDFESFIRGLIDEETYWEAGGVG